MSLLTAYFKYLNSNFCDRAKNKLIVEALYKNSKSELT